MRNTVKLTAAANGYNGVEYTVKLRDITMLTKMNEGCMVTVKGASMDLYVNEDYDQLATMIEHHEDK